MFVTKRCVARRTVLRGIGATLALPLLDSMVPAFALPSQKAVLAVPKLGFVYVGNSASTPGFWTPAATGESYELTPILQPLSPFRDRVLVVSGLDNRPGEAWLGEPGGGHARCSGAFLTGVHAKPTEGADLGAGVSVDQIAASHIGRQSQLASLELTLDSPDVVGTCDAGFSCAYTNTISWRGASSPLPMENNPRAVFERLFGDSGSTDPGVRLRRMLEHRTILDSISDKIADLQRELGAQDRIKLSNYLEAIRDIERRIQNAEDQGIRQVPEATQPAGIPESFEEHVKLMFDLQVLAYQTETTRVITLMLVRELSNRTYPEIGVPEPHHEVSHHQDSADRLAKLATINTYHMTLFAEYLNKLRATSDGDGTLLDHTLILYGSGMGNSNLHEPRDLPILLAGGAAAGLKAGRHVRCHEGTPLANLYVTMLGKLGIPVEQFGDSTGSVPLVSDI
jgi:hypothetical protein